jgi:hypothetical protein
VRQEARVHPPSLSPSLLLEIASIDASCIPVSLPRVIFENGGFHMYSPQTSHITIGRHGCFNKTMSL